MLPSPVGHSVRRYLAQIDRLLPGVVEGFYVVGSVALGAYRPARSDIDFVAVVGGDFDARAIRRLRVQHVQSGLWTAASAIRDRRSPLAGTCNGIFIRQADLGLPVMEIEPVAAHIGRRFPTSPVGSDLSPVAWKVFAERGIPVRGPEVAQLSLDPQPDLLTSWNLGNLRTYWRPWATSGAASSLGWFRTRPRYSTAWGVLGPPRLHCTITTGEVVSKEDAGEYARDQFDPSFGPLIEDALAYWRGEPAVLHASAAERCQRTTEFVLEVVAAAEAIAEGS